MIQEAITLTKLIAKFRIIRFFNNPTGMTGEEFAHCPTCPNTAEFKPYIDNPKEVYIYNPETNTAALKVTSIQEVTLTGKAKSSDSGPGILALSALLVSRLFRWLMFMRM